MAWFRDRLVGSVGPSLLYIYVRFSCKVNPNIGILVLIQFAYIIFQTTINHVILSDHYPWIYIIQYVTLTSTLKGHICLNLNFRNRNNFLIYFSALRSYAQLCLHKQYVYYRGYASPERFTSERICWTKSNHLRKK